MTLHLVNLVFVSIYFKAFLPLQAILDIIVVIYHNLGYPFSLCFDELGMLLNFLLCAT